MTEATQHISEDDMSDVELDAQFNLLNIDPDQLSEVFMKHSHTFIGSLMSTGARPYLLGIADGSMVVPMGTLMAFTMSFLLTGIEAERKRWMDALTEADRG